MKKFNIEDPVTTAVFSAIGGLSLVGIVATGIWLKTGTEDKNKDSQEYAELKNTEIDKKVLTACEKLVLSGDTEKPIMKKRCETLRVKLNEYKKLSRQISRDIKQADARRVVQRTTKGLQMRQK